MNDGSTVEDLLQFCGMASHNQHSLDRCNARATSEMGHLRPGGASSKSGHVRYGPIATKFRVSPKCREGLYVDIDPWSALQFAGLVASTL